MKQRLPALLLALVLTLSAVLPLRAAAYSDVDAGSWFAPAVAWAEDIVTGWPDGTFRPDSPCTRAQTAAFLHRFAGSPDGEAADFSDVPPGHWASRAVGWCAGAEITAGVGDGQFAPDLVCSRAQIVTFLYRLAGYRGETRSPAGDLSPYQDAGQVPGYALDAMAWAVGTGLVSGTGPDTLSPNAPCTRAQVVTMLWRWAGQDWSYETRTVPVYRDSLDTDETAALRFYDDLPNVPYMSVAGFYETFFFDTMTVARTGDVYTLTQSDGTAATVNIRTDTLDAPDLTRFTRPPFCREDGSLVAETVPYLEVASVTVDRAPAPAHLNFKAYGIDLRGDGDGLYAPVATLSDLFAGYENYFVAWNGSALYLSDLGNFRYAASAMAEDPHYYDSILAMDPRHRDLADFSYRELCFNLDTFYGLPGSAPLNDALAREGLDRALTGAAPQVRDLLQSEDPARYAGGLTKLMRYWLNDKGHTHFSGLTAFMASDLAGDVVRVLLQIDGLAYPEPFQNIIRSNRAVTADREAAFGAGTWHTKGEVAVYTFDVFQVDYDGWDAYYDGSGPLPEDTVGSLYRALEEAQADPAIRYFVLDLTRNGGGDTNALYGVEALVLGQAVLRAEDRLTGQIITQTFRADRNLDRVFDRRDQGRYDLDFALLTSVSTFSCANILATDCRDAGLPLFGEQSGGGACPVQDNVTAEGLPYRMSSWLRFLDRSGAVMDGGVPVDRTLVTISTVTHEDKGGIETQEKDYSACYDLDRLGELLRAYYEDGAQAA